MHVFLRVPLIVGALLATSGSVSPPVVAIAQQPPPPTPTPVVPLRLPAEIKATLNVPVLIEAQSTGKLHRWRADGGLVIVPPNGNAAKVWVVPVVKARIRLVCTTVTETDFVDAETVVVVDGAQPGPGPLPPPFPIPPNPTPPVPPNPTPPTPPVDPLFAKLLASFLDDPLPIGLKKVQLRSLGAVYEAAAQLAGDQSISTAADLLKRIKSVSDITVAPGSLTTLRKLLVAELQAALGDEPSAALTADQRARAAALFLRVAGLLSKLG